MTICNCRLLKKREKKRRYNPPPIENNKYRVQMNLNNWHENGVLTVFFLIFNKRQLVCKKMTGKFDKLR